MIMTIQEQHPQQLAHTVTNEVPASLPRFGMLTPLAITIGIWVVSILGWWLLADPDWSPFGASLPVVTALLFWTVQAHIFTGFTFQNWPFSKLAQPLAGIVQVVVDVALAFAIVWLFTFVIGSWDPTFSHSASGGGGYLATAFVVLIGFSAYGIFAVSLAGYPFEDLSQPGAGWSRWFMAAFVTTVGVVVLIYPNFSSALAPNAPLALPTMLGWFYQTIPLFIVAAMLWGNWPWSLVRNRHIRALTALAVILGGAVGVFHLFRVILRVIVPSRIRALDTFSLDAETAQLGGCFAVWGLTWGLVWNAWPTRFGTVVNRLASTAIVTLLSITTYLLFMNFFGTKVLHFPALDGAYGGLPLTWAIWVVLFLLWYSVAFGSYGSTREPASGPSQGRR